MWIAEEKGLFKKHGIESEVILIGGASAGGVSSLIAGDVQFLGGGGGGVINAALGGADVIMIGSIVNKGVQRVVARGDLKRPEDLRSHRGRQSPPHQHPGELAPTQAPDTDFAYEITKG